MKNTTNFFAGWFFLRALFTGLIIALLIDLKNLNSEKSVSGLVYFGIYLVFFILKFFKKENFDVVQKIMRSELLFLGIFSLNSKIEGLLVCTLFAVAEFLHFQNQFCKIVPSEKWDGNEVVEEVEE
jgi:hypothetical protein